ncbi:MAG: hypothetical protein KDE09_06980 [Anaerolineales bacterium]|nr:hypothetical protein [Anaerolineales bacterium]
MVEIPLCGVIQAGQPLAVLDGYEADESIFLDCSQLSRHSGDLFALRVRGDSMIDALVAEGDIIVLDQKSEVRNGDLVAAWLTEREELTLKYWYREGPRTRLQPANRTMGPIYVPAGEVVPQGKVIFVQRQLAYASSPFPRMRARN